MDNDHKVIHDTGLRVQNPEVGLFLRGSTLLNENEKPEAYNLDREYAKTKKNKSVFSIILMLVVIAVVGLMTVLIARYIDYQNKQITVGIDVFEDLNLKKLLDVVTRTENSLNSAISQKSKLEQEKQSALDDLAAKYEADLFLVDSMNISAAKKTERKRQLDSQYALDCTAVEQKYDGQILEADALISEYQKQLSDLDGKNVAMAQEQKAAIDSQRQLFEIEKQKLVDDYEAQIEDLRTQLQEARTESLSQQRSAVTEVTGEYQSQISELDPVINNIQGKRILDLLETEEPAERFTDASIDTENLPESFIAAIEKMRSELSDFDKIWTIVASVPQKNSIPQYVKALKQLAYQSGTTLGNGALQAAQEFYVQQQALVSDYEAQITAKDNELATVKKSLAVSKSETVDVRQQLDSVRSDNAVLKTELDETIIRAEVAEEAVSQLNRAANYFNNSFMKGNAGGYIIAAATKVVDKQTEQNDGLSEAALVYLNPSYNDIADGLKAYVYRSENQLVGMVSIFIKNGFTYASPISGSMKGSLQAGDFLVPDLSSF